MAASTPKKYRLNDISDEFFRMYNCEELYELFDIPIKVLISFAKLEKIPYNETDTFTDLCVKIRNRIQEYKLSDIPLNLTELETKDCNDLALRYSSLHFKKLMTETYPNEHFGENYRSGSPREQCRLAKIYFSRMNERYPK
jgi:hypothetical protein